jgi:predicted metal-binding membrane protein
MNTSTLVIIAIVISISLLTWLVSIWQYDPMMSSMMIFYHNSAALSLFVAIWTAGMAAMMFPAIIPMILVFSRLINTNNATSNNPANSNTSGQLAYHRGNNNPNNGSITSNGIGYPEEEGGDKSNIIHGLRNTLQSKSPDIIIFVSAYLAIWALTGIVLLVGWSFFFDALLLQLGLNVSQQPQQQLLSANTIYGIVLIVAGIYQFSSLKTKCLGYCESPLSFFMRRWQKGRAGALKMGMYHGLYCLGCCWPYFLLMVALGWMNVLWMGLFAVIIFAEKVWTRGGLWIARITGIGFVVLGILSVTGLVLLPSDSMTSSDNDQMMAMTMNMPSSSTSDNMIMSMDMASSSSS